MRGGDGWLETYLGWKQRGGGEISSQCWLLKGGERWLVIELVGKLTCNQCRRSIEANEQENI